MSNSFCAVRTTAPDAKAKLQLVKELAYFVSKGINKMGFPPSGLRTASVVNAIQASLAESMVYGSTEKITEKVLRERVLNAYLAEFDGNSKLFLKELVTPTPVTSWDEEKALITKRYDNSVAYLNVPPTLDGALAMAWLNLRRAQQRWISWMCLGAMLHQTPQGQERDSPEYQDFEAVSKALRHETRGMEKRVLMFALIKGGTAANDAREWLMRTTLSEGMSIMEYLEYDGALPSRYRVDDEKTLRESIRNS